MSVQSQIDRINQNVANTYAVLEALGADMPATQNSDNLAATAGSAKAVLYSEQTLTEEQKAQARGNIGAISETELIEELAKRGQLKPEFANSIEECTDTTKLYVLPDGFVYAYILTEVETGGYTNRVPTSIGTDRKVFNESGYRVGYRVSSSGEEKTNSLACCTGYIKVMGGDTIRFTGWDFNTNNSGNAINAYDSSFTHLGQAGKTSNYGIFVASGGYNAYGNSSWTEANGVWTWTVPPSDSGVEYIRISGYDSNGVAGTDMIVTVNEPIVEKTTVQDYGWTNTGHAFVPADYEDRIIALEDALVKIETHSEHFTRVAVNNLPNPNSVQFSITDNPNRKLIWSDGYVWRNVADDKLTHTASAYQTMKVTDGSVMSNENADAVYSAHSITKVLSAIAITRKVANLGTTVSVTDNDIVDTGSSFVASGDVATYETLLNCALIVSDNNATRAMARAVGYLLNPSASNDTAARNAFANELTSIMAELGMNHSDVRSDAADSGLHTTANDICNMYKYVLENCPTITSIWGKLNYSVTVSGSNPRTWTVTSTTNSGARVIIPEFVGGKTGSNDTMGAYAFVWKSVHDGLQYITAFLDYPLETNSRWSNARQNVDEVYSLTNG